MKTKHILWIVIIVVIAMVAALPKLFAERKTQGGTSAAKAGSKGAPVAVTAIVLVPQKLSEKIVAPGTILANEYVELKSESIGRLLSVSVKEGSRTAKGTILAKINDADLQAQLLKANVSLRGAQENETRQKSLFDKEAISVAEYETARRALESAQADVALISAQIAKTEVRAPFNGILGLKYVSTGAYVSAGTTITTLVNDRPLKVDFSIPDKYSSRIKSGDRIEFTTAGVHARNSGTVYAIDPQSDESTRSIRVRALCTNPDKGIVPGAFAEVSLILGENNNALMVPSPALVPDATGQKVFCIKNGTAVATPVTTGIRDSVLVEITSGLRAGDSVIVTGVLLVRPGSPVTLKTGGGNPVEKSGVSAKVGRQKKQP